MFDLLREAPIRRETSGTSEQVQVKSRIPGVGVWRE